jgi:hypothetical protein
VTGIANLPAQSSRTFNLQLLLHDPRQWNNLFMNARREDYTSERDACGFRV